MITAPSERKLFLIDAYALIFRAYYAFMKNPRINSKGLNTSAIFGFTNALIEVIRKESPSHLAVVFDPPGGSFRNETYAEYKANRNETPEDIKRSVPWILQVLEGLNIPSISEVGFEADDVIGYLAKEAEKVGFDVYMMTPDKDFGQLVSEKIRMYRPGRSGNPAEVWGPDEICEKFDVDNPLQIIDLLGMMGDSADNIPGIPGVGAKTASKLIKHYGSLEGVIENAGELKGKLKERVEENVDLARLSKELATICLDIPMEFDWDQMVMEPPKSDELRATLEELEFRTLAQRMLGGAAVKATPISPEPTASNTIAEESAQLDLFGTPANAATGNAFLGPEGASGYRSIKDVETNYQIVQTLSELNAMLEALLAAPIFAFDTETSSLDTLRASLVGIAFSNATGSAWWVPATAEEWTESELMQKLKPLFADATKEAVAHHFKFDYKILHRRGITFHNRIFDTMVAHYLIQPESSHKLDRLAEIELGYATIPITDLIGKAGKDQKSMMDLPVESLTDYACEDADVAFQLRERFTPQLEGVAAMELFRTVEMPLVQILADMELEGVRINSAELAEYSETLGQQIAVLTEEIHGHAGHEFNIDSPKQLGPILFETLEIKAKIKKTKTGQYPTGEEVLEKIKDAHAIVPAVLRYRKLKKLKSTYVDPLPKLVFEESGRVHTTYQQTVAATGRLSSKDPNLQNIPIRTEEGRAIRKAFVPRDEQHVLVAADYSQVELRIAAALSKDSGLVEAFIQGHDVHTATAAKVFGVPTEEVDRGMRSKAKAVNFGILYGQGAFGLAQNLGIPRREAKEIIDAYFVQFAQLKAFTADCVEAVREKGYAETVLGRRRYLPDIQSNNATVRAFAERNAVNAPIQGSAADIIKVAMVRMNAALKEHKMQTRMIMQVHDELVFDVPKNEIEQLQAMISEAMSKAVTLDVPLVVEMCSGQNWLEAH
jgi:DNA polymerase I